MWVLLGLGFLLSLEGEYTGKGRDRHLYLTLSHEGQGQRIKSARLIALGLLFVAPILRLFTFAPLQCTPY